MTTYCHISGGYLINYIIFNSLRLNASSPIKMRISKKTDIDDIHGAGKSCSLDQTLSQKSPMKCKAKKHQA